jgi:hypothetical protein
VKQGKAGEGLGCTDQESTDVVVRGINEVAIDEIPRDGSTIKWGTDCAEVGDIG